MSLDSSEPPDRPPEHKFKPLFLTALPGPEEEKPDDASWGDWTLVANKPLRARHKEFCRLLWLGKTNNHIAQTMGISVSRVSVLASNTRIQEEISRLQETAFDRTIGERLNDMAPAALDTVEHILTSGDPNVKIPIRKEMAIWLLEKVSGKAKQEVEHTSSTLDKFYSMMSDMQKAGETLSSPRSGNPAQELSGQIIDVTPETREAGAGANNPAEGRSTLAEPVAERSKYAAWADENLGQD